jgi:hypothetical protein
MASAAVRKDDVARFILIANGIAEDNRGEVGEVIQSMSSGIGKVDWRKSIEF